MVFWFSSIESPTQDKRKYQNSSDAPANRNVITSSVSSVGIWVSDEVGAVAFGTRKQVVSTTS